MRYFKIAYSNGGYTLLSVSVVTRIAICQSNGIWYIYFYYDTSGNQIQLEYKSQDLAMKNFDRIQTELIEERSLIIEVNK
jgi:hypothetical protein